MAELVAEVAALVALTAAAAAEAAAFETELDKLEPPTIRTSVSIVSAFRIELLLRSISFSIWFGSPLGLLR